jgi:PAS domain S-box-containing protein
VLLTSTRFRSLSDPESLREFAKNLREGIYISTRDGRMLDANRAFLETFGVERLSDLGEFGASNLFVDPTRRTAQMELLDRDGSVREFEIEMRRPDGDRASACTARCCALSEGVASTIASTRRRGSAACSRAACATARSPPRC